MNNRTKKTLWLLAFAVFIVMGVSNIVLYTLLHFLYFMIISIFATICAAISMYAYCTTKVSTQVDTNNAATESPEDKLLKYKQLLDNGAITQEEYEEKKKQLLF